MPTVVYLLSFQYMIEFFSYGMSYYFNKYQSYEPKTNNKNFNFFVQSKQLFNDKFSFSFKNLLFFLF